jgi:dihydroorotase
MPNTTPPITTTELALQYYDDITTCLPAYQYKATFQPLMTLYLTDNTTEAEIKLAKATGKINACKFYPAGATTNSQFGVSDVKKAYPAIHAMQECGMLLLIHSEVSRSNVDIFDREKVFIEEVMIPLVADFPDLKIVMEHVSTKNGVDYVKSAGPNIAASITCHHLLYNRNAILVGGIKPHYYCLPILKREMHRVALLEAATSGSAKFIMGTDSAPHDTKKKESSCGCAG